MYEKKVRLSTRTVHTKENFSTIIEKEEEKIVGLKENLSNNLKAMRTVRGASLMEFSKEAGISKSALQSIECGRGSTLDTVDCIARSLCLPPEVLLAEEPAERLDLYQKLLEGTGRFAALSQEERRWLVQHLVEMADFLDQVGGDRL